MGAFSKIVMTLAALAAACSTAADDPQQQPQPRMGVRVDRLEHSPAGYPYFAVGAFGRVRTQLDTIADASALDPVLPAIAEAMRVPAGELVAKRVLHDPLGMTHVIYHQQKHGLRVVGGDLAVHLDALGQVRSVNSTAQDAPGIPTTPTITADAAIRIAIGATAAGQSEVRGTPELVYVIAARDELMHLAWEITAAAKGAPIRDRVYVSALDGSVVARHAQVVSIKNRTIYDAQNSVYGDGIEVMVGNEATPPTGDATAVGAFTNTGISYDCLKTLFDRDSYDGAGAALDSLVHVRFYDGPGSGNNAVWDGTRMVFGDGDGQTFTPFAASLDVTAHELTHGLTQQTADLAYEFESGALNESMSDILAAACEAHHDGAISAETWLVGEDIFTPGTPGDALRYMDDPTKDASLYPPEIGGSRDYYPERYTGQEDFGGVHLNSGIPNLAFQLLTDGGRHPREKTPYVVPAIGIRKAGAIFYTALTQGYFSTNTTLAQARTLTGEVAAMIDPASASAVAIAWASVGVGGAPPTDPEPPTVSFVAPGDGDTVPQGFAVEVAATDNQVVSRVALSLDGVAIGEDDTAPYTFATSATLPPGTHTLQATAFDNTNMATASIMVTVVDPTLTPDAGDGNPADGDGGGCCSAQRSGEPVGAALLFGLAAFVVRRRRR